MRLQELKKKEAVQFDEATGKRVRVLLHASFYLLDGDWQWPMETTAVFCSDVLFSQPEEFIGTKAIFHPDDVPVVKESLSGGGLIPSLTFRIITTYGEVKTISGENIVVVEELPHDWQQDAVLAAAQSGEEKAERTHLQLLKGVDEQISRFSGIGRWYYNAATHQTWYANFVYQLHGLAPQSLNAHLHTFQSFIHPDDRALVLEYSDRAFRDKAPLHIDYRIVVGKAEKWVSYKAHWFYSSKGEEILGGIYQDITEQKRADQEIESYKGLVQFQRQQLLYNEQQLAIGHWQLNLLTRKITFSDQYYRIYGLKPQSLTPTINAFLNYVHPGDREGVEAAYKRLLYEHTIPDLEYRIVRNDGKTRYLQQKARLVTVEQELIVSGIIQDVTVQRMLEKKVADQADALQLRQLLAQQSDEQTSLLSWVMDFDENTLTWSDSFYKLLGQSRVHPGNVTEKTLFSLVHPQDMKTFRQHWNAALNEKQPAAFAIRFLVRGVVQYMKAVFNFYPLDDKNYFIGTLQNTTAEQVLQQQLSQRVQLAESLSENTLDRVIITDANNTVLLWNKSCEQAYDIRKAEAIGQNIFDLVPQLKTESEMQAFSRVLHGEKVVREGARSALGKGYDDLYLVPLYNGEEVSGILHIRHDVTKEVELRNSLYDRLQLIEGLVQSSVDRIVVLDQYMNYVYWNKMAEQYYGVAKEKVIGHNILEVFPGFRTDPGYAEFRKVLRGETVYLPPAPAQEGNDYFETYLVPVKDEKGEVSAILWMVHDLSNEWQLQQERQKAQAQLQEEHSLLKEAQAIGHVGSFEWTAATDTIYWSDELYRIHGLKPQSERITHERVLSFLHPDDLQYADECIRRARLGAGNVTLTHRIVRTDGEERTVVRKIRSFTDESGAVTHLRGTLQDITEQKRAEEQVREKAYFLQRILETSPDMVSIMDLATRKAQYLNEEAFAANGFSAEYMTTKSPQELIELIHADDRQTLAAYFETLTTATDEEVSTAEYRAKTCDGEWSWFFVRGKVFQRNKAGQATQVLNVIENITGRKKAEERVKANQELLAATVDRSPELIQVFEAVRNEKGEISDFVWILNNHAASRYYGDVIGKSLLQHNPGVVEEGIFDAFKEVVESGVAQQYEKHYVHEQFNGWFRQSVVKLNDGVATTTIDITDTKNAELQVQKNVAVLQQAEEMAQMGSWEYDVVTSAFNWSEGMYRLFGLPQGSKVRPEIYLDFATEKDRSIAKRIVKNLKKDCQPFEETMQIKRGSEERLLKIKGSVTKDENGRPQRLVGVDLDITDIKAAEEKVKETRHWIQQMAQASPDAITIYDLQQKQPIYLNDCLANWIGTTLQDLVSMGIDGRLQLIHPDDRLRVLHFNEKLKAATDGQVLTLEYSLYKKDGTLLWICNRSKVFQRNERGEVTHVLSILQDVTEEKASERMLKALNASLEKKNQELENANDEITSFAFVASHDLKEPLRKLHTFSNWLLTREPALSDAGRQSLEKMNGAVKRLDQLIDDILALTKVHVDNERLKKVDLNGLLEQLKQELSEKLERTGATIEARQLPVIIGAENQLFYLFKNLISNSLTFQAPGNQPQVCIEAKTTDEFLVISFRDNGIGIAPEYHKKIFEMFRRLHGRHEYEGTGIGLAICRRIMEKHGGKITVQSSEGQGSVFACWFPVALSTT